MFVIIGFVLYYFIRLLFSPPSTNDEEKDAAIHRRIRQLSWINARHLVCSIDEVNADVRDLVYGSINGNTIFHSISSVAKNCKRKFLTRKNINSEHFPFYCIKLQI